MQHFSIASAIAVACVASSALAQTIVIPNGFATVEANSSTSYPWSRTTAVIHVQYCFDSSHFTAQSINFPILINRLKWRANSSTVATTGGTYSNVGVDLSTAAVDQALITNNFANNHGPNRANVFSGSVTVLPTPSVTAGTPNIYYVDIPITPFLYDPTLGDLLIDTNFPAASWAGGTANSLDCQTTGSLVSRMFDLTTNTAPTGTVQLNVGPVIEVGYNPAAGLYANFTSNVTAGPVPTTVNFTDATFTSAPGGITSWAWDLDGDNVTDSTLQNPSFTYSACGAYNVRLTATDGTHPASTITKTGYIQIGITPIVPSYTSAPLAPGVYQFTDTSTPTPASWAWDFNGDMIVDSTAQNPTWAYAPCTTSASVTLSVSSTCAGPWSTTGTLVLLPPIVPSFTFAALGGGVFQFTDTSTPTPATWAWDLNGDMVTDSTAQNPTWAYTAPCTSVSVSLSVTSACAGPWSTSKPIVLSPLAATAVPFLGGNGTTGVAFVGNMFDLTVTAPAGINVCAITQGIYSYVGPFSADIYITDGTYIGKEATAAAWRLVASGTGTSAGGAVTPSNPYPVALNHSFYLPAGNYGMVVFLSRPGGAMNVSYTNSPQGPFVGPDVTFYPNPTAAPGRVSTALFTTAGIVGRCWNGTLHYSKLGNGNEAGYGFAGSGCPGTMPVATLTPNHPPTLSSTMTVAINNLPNSVALMMTGFSRTTSILGPLPLAGAGYGAPGCNLRVSPDANVLLIGAANAATWSLTVPGGVGLIGLLLHQQAIVFNPGFNGAGAVISDATSMMIGN